MLVFAEARSVAWLFAARILQGVATGIAIGAISAALLDLQPGSKPRLGALVGVAAPLTGLATGALGAGLLVQYGPVPLRLIFWLLLGGVRACDRCRRAIPETVARDAAWRSSLRPRVAVPQSLRVAFVATIPCLAATWALGGLVLSLGPSLMAGVLGDASHVAGGLPIFVMAGVSALASVRLRDTHARTTARGGLAALIVGVGLALVALGTGSTALFLAAAAIAGLGFGPAFGGAFRALSTRAPEDQRAALRLLDLRRVLSGVQPARRRRRGRGDEGRPARDRRRLRGGPDRRRRGCAGAVAPPPGSAVCAGAGVSRQPRSLSSSAICCSL